MKEIKFRTGVGAAIVAVALTVAACGSASSSSSSSTSTKVAKASSSAAAATGPAKVQAAKGKVGTYLTGPNGHALYLWMGDSAGKSNCTGACAGAWMPLTTSGSPVAGAGVTAADLATIGRSGGAEQVTYKGHPLYYFSGDSAAGQTNGQGSTAFGAKWWLVSPAGASITGSGKSSSGSSGSGGWAG